GVISAEFVELTDPRRPILPDRFPKDGHLYSHKSLMAVREVFGVGQVSDQTGFILRILITERCPLSGASQRATVAAANDAVDGATLRHRTAIVWVR
ncbi:MAG: hypothetical protein WBQ55_23485, partial [Xanthobacteraceae bacterium]